MSQKVAISGATGLIGRKLCDALSKDGYQVFKLIRHKDSSNANTIYWNPLTNEIEQDKLEGSDCVVHLAGENIASGRWNHARKLRIKNSRVLGTQLISATLAKLEHKPKVFVCASAIGFYGSRADEIMTEDSGAGSGFLAEVGQAWEASSAKAEAAKIRTVKLRVGVVLSKEGGALAKMLLPFKLGLAGIIGNGSQYMSWISLPDVLRVIQFAIKQGNLSGALNAVAPNPVTNLEFTKTLGKSIKPPYCDSATSCNSENSFWGNGRTFIAF